MHHNDLITYYFINSARQLETKLGYKQTEEPHKQQHINYNMEQVAQLWQRLHEA